MKKAKAVILFNLNVCYSTDEEYETDNQYQYEGEHNYQILLEEDFTKALRDKFGLNFKSDVAGIVFTPTPDRIVVNDLWVQEGAYNLAVHITWLDGKRASYSYKGDYLIDWAEE